MITLSLLVAFLALLPKMEGIPLPPPRPLCASQFALANYACQALPYTPGPPPIPPSPPIPPVPPCPDDPDSGCTHNHPHRHRHRHRSGHRETPEQENCCRWLRELDTECVCELLVRLPSFLVRPTHDLTVIVDETCNVTFTCGSRLIRA